MLGSTLEWDDVRVFLAVLRASSLRGAAQSLGVSHPTVSRRLDSLESQLRLQLFDRRSDGLRPTAHAEALEAAAEEAERAMQEVARRAHAQDPGLHGPVRVSLPNVCTSTLLMPEFAAFAERWPEIQLQLMLSSDLADLGRREADVAVRFMRHGRPPASNLFGRKAITAYRAVYGHTDHWLGWEPHSDNATWVATTPFPDLPVRHGLADVELQRAACAAGMGRTYLPCFVAEPGLPRLTEPVPGFDVWVLVHPDLRKSPRLRIFRDAVVEALQKHAPRFEGRSLNPARQDNVAHPPSP